MVLVVTVAVLAEHELLCEEDCHPHHHCGHSLPFKELIHMLTAVWFTSSLLCFALYQSGSVLISLSTSFHSTLDLRSLKEHFPFL